MKKLIIALLVIVIIGTLILAGCTSTTPSPTPTPTSTPTQTTPSTQTFELKFAYWIPPPIPISKLGYEAWGQEIAAATGGRITIKFFGGGAMGQPADHYDLLKSGTADIANFVPAFTPGVFPMDSIANLPILFPSAEIAATSLWQFHQKYTLNSDFKDIKLLAVSPVSPLEIINNVRQIKTLEDLKGMKIAVTAPTVATILDKLGASAVFMPEGDVYTSLERGLVDGRVHQWDGAVVWKGMEVTKYRTGNVDIAIDEMVIGMNKDTWNKLPSDLKDILTGASGLFLSRHFGMVFDRANNDNLLVMQAYDKKVGNPDIYWLPAEEKARWATAVSPLYDEWVADMNSKGLPGQAALNDLKALVAQSETIYK